MMASNGTLLVSTDEMTAAARQLEGYLGQMQSVFDTIKNKMSGTEAYWVGDAGNTHRQLYLDQVSRTDEMIRRYQEHITDLNTMAGVYVGAEQSATAEAEQLPTSNL